MAFSIVLLSHETAFSQSEIIVEPGENTLLDAVRDSPGSTLILKKGEEYMIDTTIQITVPTIIRGEEYALDDTDPPAVIRMFVDPGEAYKLYMFSADADLKLKDLGFIGFTATNKQIAGVCEVAAAYIDIEASGCILQGCSRWMWTDNLPGIHFLLQNNIHFNSSAHPWA